MKKIYILMIAMLIGGIAKGQWQQTTQFGHPLGLTMFDNNDTVIYGSNGGQLYKTANNGLNWSKISMPNFYSYGINSLKVTDSSICVLGYGGMSGFVSRFFISFNNGNSWLNYNDSIPVNANINNLMKYNDTLYLSTNKGIYISANKGLSWYKKGVLDTIVIAISVNGANIYAIVYNNINYGYGVKKSIDNGNTWIDINSGLPANRDIISIFAKNNKIFANLNNDSVYVSENDGISWKPMQNGLVLNTCSELNSFTEYNDTIYYDDCYTVYKASINDSVWKPISLPFYGTYSIINNLKLLGATKGVFISYNSDSTWTPINNGIDVYTNIQALTKYGNDIYAATYQEGVFKSKDRGQSWISLNNIYIDNEEITDLAAFDSVIYAGTYNYGVKKTNNNGQTWIYINNGLNCLKVNSIKFNGTKLFAATDCGLFISNDYGQSWLQSSIGLNDTMIYSVVVEGNNVFAKTYNDLYVSGNEGISWNLINYNCEGSILSVEGNKIFAGDFYNGKYSEDYGLSWDTINSNLGISFFVNGSLIKSNKLILSGYRITQNGDYAKIFVSFDKGQNWIEYTDTLSNKYSKINSMVVLNDTLFAAFDGTVWKRPLFDFVGIAENTQNNNLLIYPNPANNTLTIDLCQLQKLQNATVSIYDIQGKQLLFKNITEKQSEIDISAFAKGIYIIKIQSDKEILQSKFVKN